MLIKKSTIAYIGFGRSVLNYHLPYTYESDEIFVKYVFVREEDRNFNIEKEVKFPRIQFITNFDILLNDRTIDFVVICSPDRTHFDYASKLINAKIPCLIEKPIATNTEDAKKIIELAKLENVKIMPNQNRRYDGNYLTLKQIIESNVLGEILEIESHYDYYRPNRNTSIPIYLFGLGVHTIDQMIALNGIPDRVVYDVRSMHSHSIGKCDDYFDIDMFYGRKKVTVKTTYYAKISSPRFIVHGTKGSCVIPQIGHQSESKNHDEDECFAVLSYFDEKGIEKNEKISILENRYFEIYRNFINAVFNYKEKIIKDNEVLCVLDILETGVKSCLTEK